MKANENGFLMLAAPGGSPCPGMETVDYAGKTYHTVRIGSRCWLKENLDVGVMIPGAQDQGDNSTIEKFCYGDDEVNCDTLFSTVESSTA